MRTRFIVLLSIVLTMETFSQNTTSDRQPFAAGRFYSADKETLTKDLNEMFGTCTKTSPGGKVQAIISPHAGYVFSGKIAAAAFSSINNHSGYKNIFIIGSSHVSAFDGASVFNTGDYITPLGRAVINMEIASALTDKNKVFRFSTESHIREHSIEVQIPFIQTYFKDNPKIIPIIIGTDNEETVKRIAQALSPWFTQENLFIISSDFSHYPAYKQAVETDKATALAIISGSHEIFLKTLNDNSDKKISGLATSMCGWTSGLLLLYLSENNPHLKYQLIDYCNSGDSPYGNKDEVVGYNAIALFETGRKTEPENVKEEEFTITKQEKAELFAIVRSAIKMQLDEKKEYTVDYKKISPKLMTPMGAFVTLKIDGALRGCIGRFISADPLYEVVKASAISSAFEDPRFSQLTKEEYRKIEIEITVLGPLKKISNISEIILGKHGIYIKKENRAGTMLPQVATENGWSVEEFLGYTSRDKAGIGWDGWKAADIYIYEGVVLEENK
jgi:AmmeMemoRadiSam system protein B/AmmeMemoRadiSam system protein A